MRQSHFDALRPVCPVCRSIAPEGKAGWPLQVSLIERAEGEHIIEGVVQCTNGVCLREYPIIDGVPFIIGPLRHYLAENMLALYGRGDLSETVESVLGDCCGSGSGFDTIRQHLSSYTWDHYGDLDPDEPDGEPRPGACSRMMHTGLGLAGDLPDGPVLDIGCSAGRASMEMAHATGKLVLGIDLHIPTLRLASQIVRRGVVRYPRRRVGLVYDRREFSVDLPGRDKVEIWACDATALPFAPGSFSAVLGLNVVDSVSSPVNLLNSVASALKPNGVAILSCPYEWSPAVTPVEAWVGGHSQRGQDRGSSGYVMRQLLTPGALASSVPGVVIDAELEDVPWHVRMHDRSVAVYKSHMFVVRRAVVAQMVRDHTPD